jgi:hypothetical protein
VNFSIDSKRFLMLTWSSMWNTMGRWSESKISATTTSQSQSHIVTDDQSVGKSWCRAPSGARDQIFVTL